MEKQEKIKSKSYGFLQILKYRKDLLSGEVLCVDPSSGSKSSMPGYAVYRKGELVESGTIEVPLGDKIYDRLVYLVACIKREFNTTPDVLVIEDIPIGKGRLRMAALRSLNMSVGAIIGALEVDKVVALHPRFWKKHARVNYSKSDEQDAIMMGEVCFKVISQLEDKDGKK